MTSNDVARQYFKDKGLTYAILNDFTIDLLASMMQTEILKMRREQPDCILVRINRPKYRKNQLNGGVFRFFELTVQGTYFESREAVSFNCDGYIGFAGWASTINTKPIVDGFIKWCDAVAEAGEA